MNFFKNLKNNLKKWLFCFDSDSVAETYPIIKYDPIFIIGDDDSDNSDFDYYTDRHLK